MFLIAYTGEPFTSTC